MPVLEDERQQQAALTNQGSNGPIGSEKMN